MCICGDNGMANALSKKYEYVFIQEMGALTMLMH